MLQLGRGLAGGGAGDALEDAGVLELVVVRVEGLGHAVGEQHQEVARLHPDRLLGEREAVEEPHRHAAGLEAAHAAPRVDEERRVVPAVAERQRAVGVELGVEQGDEAALDGPPDEGGVEPGQGVGRTGRDGGLRGQAALRQGPEEGGRRPLAGDVTQREPEPALRQVDVLEEVAADREARQHLGRGVEERAGPAAGGQQGLLYLRRRGHLLVEPGLLHRGPVEPRVVDGHGRLGGQGVEGGAGLRGQQVALRAAVEIEHADAAVLGGRVPRLDVAHQAQRHAQHVADAERDGALVLVGEVAVEQIGLDARPARAEDLLRYLAAGLERVPRQRGLVARAAQLELEPVVVARQHDETAFGPADGDSGVEDHRQHVVEHLAGAQRPQPLQQHRDLVQLADGGALRGAGGGGLVVRQEDELGPLPLAEPDPVAVREPVLRDGLAVHEDAVAGPAVAEAEAAVGGGDLGVDARHVGVRQVQVAPDPPPDGEWVLVQEDHPPSVLITDLESRLSHGTP